MYFYLPLYPLHARHGSGGSTALPSFSALLIACPPGEDGRGERWRRAAPVCREVQAVSASRCALSDSVVQYASAPTEVT
jgi:hypothetical protein